MIILNVYQFTDGIRAYFIGNNKLNHFVCMNGDTIDFGNYCRFDKIKTKKLKLSYPRWKSLVQKWVKKNKGKVRL